MDRKTRRVALLFAVGTIVFVGVMTGVTQSLMEVFEHRAITRAQAFLFVVETMTTTGYGELLPFRSWVMTAWATFVMLTGFAVLFIMAGAIATEWVKRRFEPLPPDSVPNKVKGHIIICSYSPLVESLIQQLKASCIPAVVVEPARENVKMLLRNGVQAILGDASKRGTLQDANIDQARALLATSDDENNADIVLEARVLSHIPIIATVEHAANTKIMTYAGADRVISPKQVLGEELARWALSSIPHTILEGTDNVDGLQLVEFTVYPNSVIANRPLSETELRKNTGATVLGYWHQGVFHLVEGGDTRVPINAVVTVMGTRGQLGRLSDLLFHSQRPLRVGTGPMVLAGFGDAGQRVAEVLESESLPLTVIDRRRDVGERTVVRGDATDERVLVEAGIREAGTYIVTLPGDAEAIFTTLIARELNEDIRILVRCRSRDTIDKLYRAGADAVLSLSDFGGQILARLLTDGVVEAVQDYHIEFMERPIDFRLAGRSMADLEIYSRTGCLVVAVSKDGKVRPNPAPNTPLEEGGLLVLMGNRASLATFESVFGHHD